MKLKDREERASDLARWFYFKVVIDELMNELVVRKTVDYILDTICSSEGGNEESNPSMADKQSAQQQLEKPEDYSWLKWGSFEATDSEEETSMSSDSGKKGKEPNQAKRVAFPATSRLSDVWTPPKGFFPEYKSRQRRKSLGSRIVRALRHLLCCHCPKHDEE